MTRTAVLTRHWRFYLMVSLAITATAACTPTKARPSIQEEFLRKLQAGSGEPMPLIAQPLATPRRQPGEPSPSPSASPTRRAEFFSGTQPFARRPAATATPPVETADGVTLNFVNADLREVARAILSDLLKAPYVIDSRIQGMVTLQTTQPVSRDAIVSVLENVLRQNGAALINTNGTYNVVPTGDALRYAPLAVGGASTTAGYSTQVIPLRYSSAEDIVNVLRGIISPDLSIRADRGRNIVIATGSQGDIANVMSMIGLFDIDTMRGMSFALLYPKQADAKSVAKELETIFADERPRSAGLVKFVPIDRLNAILVASRVSSYLNQAAAWVERLDQNSETTEDRLYVYYVQNGKASELATTLTAIFNTAQSSATSSQPALPTRGMRTTDESTDLSLNTPGAGASQPGAAFPGMPNSGQPRFPGALEPPAPALDAPRAETRFAASSTAQDGIALTPTRRPKIIADERTNALLIMATPKDYANLEAALLKLDIAPLQVLIEAVVAEVTLTNELRYGLQWLFGSGAVSGTLSTADTGAVLPVYPGFSTLLQSGNGIRAVLNALESITAVNVLSSPQLMAQNNQTATLQVGDQVPIATQSATSVTTPGAPVVNTIQFRDTGVILRVTPRVNEGGLVQLEINQEVSDVARTTTSGIDSPTIQQRKFNSTVSVPNGETVVLGGLIRDRRSDGDSGFPVLKDIPILGNLFKTTTVSDNRTELVVLITPKVVRSRQDISRVTSEFRDRLQSIILSGMPSDPPRKR